MNEASIALFVAIAGGLIQVGFYLATVKELKRNVNGIGSKTKNQSAEIIILARWHPNFETIVRKVINGI